MSNTSDRRAARRDAGRHRRLAIVGGASAAVAAVALVVTISRGDGSNAAPSLGTNAMGMPYIATPGTSSGTSEAGGVTVTPASVALGDVPLNVAVLPTWTFTNTSNRPVSLGETHVQVNEGCCPGAVTFDGATTLDPGASTTMRFELSMHPGMDGPHDMTLHVPVAHADGTTDTLDVTVTGDFHD